MSIAANIESLQIDLKPIGVTLIAVSKTKSNEEIMEAYNAGQRQFGENLVQEMVEKYEDYTKYIEWHLIGHLQSNIVKYIGPFVSMVQSIDSLKVIKEINYHDFKHV